MAFTGMLPMEVEQVVLVSEDTIYSRERIDHAARLLLLQRPQIAAPVQMAMRLQVPRPSPVLFEDRFVSVYPVIEIMPTAAVQPPTQPPQPFFLAYRPSTRLPDPDSEESTRRIDLGMLHAFRWRPYAPGIMPYTVEIPDLCDNPWIEYVHPPKPIDSELLRTASSGAPRATVSAQRTKLSVAKFPSRSRRGCAAPAQTRPGPVPISHTDGRHPAYSGPVGHGDHGRLLSGRAATQRRHFQTRQHQ
jgi:hypothetical protein